MNQQILTACQITENSIFRPPHNGYTPLTICFFVRISIKKCFDTQPFWAVNESRTELLVNRPGRLTGPYFVRQDTILYYEIKTIKKFKSNL